LGASKFNIREYAVANHEYEGYISTENKQLSPIAFMQNADNISNLTLGTSFRLVTDTSLKAQRGYLHDLR